jgi:carbonic anhydrase
MAIQTSSAGSRLLRKLLEGNQRFREAQTEGKSFHRMDAPVEGSDPVATVLCCSDSRIAPELVFDQGIGSLFVIRTAGASPSDVAMGSIEFAVQIANSPLLFILGHEDCRAIHTASTVADTGLPHWNDVLNVIRPSLLEVGPEDRVRGESALDAKVRANTRRTGRLLLEKNALLGKRIANGELLLATAIYRVTSGEVLMMSPTAQELAA